MSTTTDNKVVEMRFNNQQFEKNANESISTLGKLKDALKFDRSSVKSLDDLQKSTKGFNLDHLTQSVDKASDHFSALGVAGMTVINRLTNAAIDFGKKAVGAMSGGLSGGFAKYSAMTDAVQVMVINSGESIEYVNGLMGELQKYVDDTSYSFEQMTRTMGNFAAVGLDLETAEEMVEGIANWAATAGVNAVKAEAAFREVSNSISNGYLQLRDAQTLMSLNMFTPDFRRLTLATAAAFGTIKEEAGKYWADIGTGAKEKWVEVTESNLTSTLRGKWFTTEVWEEVMHLYADTSGALSELDKQLLEAAGLSEDFGQKAFDAAYEAKTFSDAIGAIRDTLSTGWSNTFEHIFGNYKQASIFWTDFASSIQEVVGAIGDARNEIIEGWDVLGGREELLGTVFEIMKNIHLTIIPIIEAFHEVFGAMDSEALYDITIMFRDFVRSLEPTDEALFALKDAFINIFSVVRILLDPVQILAKAFWNLVGSAGKIIGIIAKLVGRLAEVVAYSGILYDVVDGIIFVVDTISKLLVTAGVVLVGFILKLKELGIFSTIFNAIKTAAEIAGAVVFVTIQNILGVINDLIDLISDIKKFGIETVLNRTDGALKTILGTIVKFKDAITNIFNFIGDKVKSLFKVKDAIKEISKETEEGLFRANKSQEAFKNTLKSFSLVDKVQASFRNFRINVTDKITEGTQALTNFFATLDKGKLAIGAALAGIVGLALKMTVFSGKGKGIGGIGGSILGNVLDIGGLPKKILLIGALGGAIALLFKKFKAAKDATDGIKEATKGIEILSEAQEGAYRAALKAEKVSGIFGTVAKVFGDFGVSIYKKIKPATDAIKNFIEGLDIGKIVLVSFVSTVVGTLAYAFVAIGSLPLLIFSLANTFNALGNAIRNWSIWGVDTFGDTAIKIGKSLLYLAGSMWIMAKIPADRFTEVANAMMYFMKTMLAMTVISSALALLGKLEPVWQFGVSLLALAGAMLVIAGALKLIEKTNPVETFGAFAAVLITLGLLMAAVAGVTQIIAKAVPTVKKGIGMLIIIAGSVAILSVALAALSFVPEDKLNTAAHAVFVIIGTYAALIAAMGRLSGSAKGALAVGVSLLATAYAFKILIQALVALNYANIGFNKVAKNWQKFAVIFGVLATSLVLVSAVAKAFKVVALDMAGAAVAALAISASIAIIIKTVSWIASMKGEIGADKIGFVVASLLTISLGLFMVITAFKGLGAEAAKASLSLLSVAFLFTTFAVLGTALSLLPPEYYGRMLGVVGVFSICIAGILAASHLAKGVQSGPILSVIALIGAISGSIVAIGKYGGDVNTILASAGAIGLVLITVALNFSTLSKISATVSYESIWGMVGVIAAIGTSLWAISRNPWQQIIAAMGAVSVTMVVFGQVYKTIANNVLNAGSVNYGALIGLVVAIGAIAYSLYEIAKHPWQQILAALAAISGTLIALGVVYTLIDTLSSHGNVLATIGGAVGFDILAAGIFILAKALKELQGITWDSIADGVKVIAQFTVAILALSAIFGLVPEIMGVGIGIIVLAFMGFAVAADVLANAIVKVAPAIGNLAIAISAASVIVSTAITNVVEAFGGFVIKLAEARKIVAEGFVMIIDAFGNFVLKVTTGISMIINSVANLVNSLVNAFATITTMIPAFSQNLAMGFVTIGAGIGAGLATIVSTFFLVLTEQVSIGIAQLLGLIESKGPEFSAKGGSIVESFVGDVISTFRANHPVLAAAASAAANVLGVGFLSGFRAPLGWNSPPAFLVGGSGFGGGFFGDLAAAFDAGAKAQESAVKSNGEAIGNSFLEGFRDYLGWHSGPDFVDNFYGDTAGRFSYNSGTYSGAFSASGNSVASSWGSGLLGGGIPFVDKLYDYGVSKLGGLLAMFGNLGGYAGADASIAGLPMEDQEGALRRQQDRSKAYAKANSLGVLQGLREGYDEYIQRQRKEKFQGGNYFESQEFTEGNRKKIREFAKEYYKAEEEAFGDGGDGGGGGGGGGGASEAAEEAAKLFDVWEDGGKIIQKTAETFGGAYEALGFTHPLQLGEAAVQGLAEKLYDLSVAGVDAATLAEVTATEKLAKMKEEFDGFISQIQDSLLNAGDIFGNFAFNDSESISKWNSNLGKQETSIDLWVKHIEQLAKRTGDFNLVDQFIKFGPSEDKRLRKLLSSSDATIKQLGENMLSYLDADGKKLNDRTARLAAALASTTLEKAKETGDGVSSEATNVAEDVTETAENAASEIDATAKETTQNYVVVNRNGAVSVINEIGKVIAANGELGKSAFDAAKVTEEAFGKMEDVYLSAKEAVSAAIGESIDLFSKFDTETEIDGEEMRENAREGLAAWEEMYNGMGQLAEKGLNVDFILDKLVPMGEQAYGYVKEMLTWTEQDINEWNAMFEKSLRLPDQLAENLGRDLASATLLASQGFISGIGNDATYEAAKKVAIGFVDTMVQQINDPNSGAPQMGVAYADAASKSIEENGDEVTNAAVKALNDTVVVSKATAYDGGYDIGGELSRGIAQGIADKIEEVRASIFDLTATTEETAEDEFEIESPSKVFQRIGRFLDLGLAKGISDNVGFINSASEAMGSNAINSMKAVVGHIADIINGEVQVDPTIRPVVDLSGVEEGAAAVNSMFGGRSYSMTRGIATMGHSDSVNDMIAQMMAAQGSVVPVVGGSPINMYVYAAPGQSEEEIANIVEQKLMFRINRQGGAWR